MCLRIYLHSERRQNISLWTIEYRVYANIDLADSIHISHYELTGA